MSHIFVEGRRLLASLHYLFSRKARLGNRYDERDLLLGHGVDNTFGLRVVMLMACCALFTLWVAMLLKPAVSTAIAFFLLFSYLCHYTQNMPRAGITDSLNSEARRAGGRYAYRSYLGGRIVFTPSGLRLSWHSSQRPDSTPNAQQGPTPTADPKQQAKALCAAISSLTKQDSDNAASDGDEDGILQSLEQVGVHISKETEKLRLLAQTTYSDDLPVEQSGYITEHVPASLQNYLVYAGCKLRLDQLVELTAANLPHMSQESGRMLLPSQVCCLGFGFKWLPKHTRRLHDIMEVGERSAPVGKHGSPDLHGVEDLRAFEPIYFTSDLLLGNTLLLGTYGAGKTRFFDLLVSQAIMRGDTVFVLDSLGDCSLQQSILRAARFSDREPLADVFCLDIGRKHMLTQQIKTDLSPEYVGLGSKVEGTAGSAARSYASSFSAHPAEELSTISPSSATGLDEAKEAEWFFAHINTGFNPISDFDRASDIADRITAMMSAADNEASFKAYVHMAVSAAVECCVLSGEPVTLEKMRSIVSDHSKFEQYVRIYLNRLVIALNKRAATIYYNRLHGIKSKKLQHNRFAVQLLLGPSGVGKASVQSELKAIATLEQYGYDLSDEAADSGSSTDESSYYSGAANADGTAEAESGTDSTKAKVVAYTATFSKLLAFYRWLQEEELIQAEYDLDQIIKICSLSPEYYKKVTTGILPYLSALTSGELRGLLSPSEEALPSFMDVVARNKIFYAALHCHKDSTTGQALGKLLLSDLAFVADQLTAKGIDSHHRVSIFIDDAAELSNESLVQLLYKPQASKFSITLAAHSVAEIARCAGSQEVASQIIAKCNNLISLRVNDPQSASLIPSMLPKTVVNERSSSQSFNEGLALNDSYSTSRSVFQRSSERFPPSMLKLLPDFEFIAYLANGAFYKGFIPLLQAPLQTSQHAAVYEVRDADPTTTQKGPVFTVDEAEFLLHKFSDQDYHPDHEPSSRHISPMALGAILQSCNRFDRAYVEDHPEAAPATGPLLWAAANKCAQKIKAKAKKPASSEPRQSNALSVGATGTAKSDTAGAGSAPASHDGTTVGGKHRLWAKVCSGVKSICSRGHTLLCRLGLLVLRALIQVFLSIPALIFYRRLYECSLLLCMTVLLSCIFNGFAAFELIFHSVSYTFSYLEALLGALCSGMWQLDTTIAVNRSFLTRCDLVLDVYLDLWPLSLSCLMMGLMSGHNFNLIAEMRHRSLMGIKKFTSFTGWPVIILLILALIMLGSAFVLFLEGSLLIAWLLIFNLGFKTACFYTQHTK